MKEGRYRESGRLIKGLLPNNMVVSQGGIRWPEYARKTQEDNVDLIGLGQALISTTTGLLRHLWLLMIL